MAQTMHDLRELPPVTWGDLFKLCRDREAMSHEAVVREMRRYRVKTSTATISRMEDAEYEPDNPRHRLLATVAMVIYGRDPLALGLDIDELPARLAGLLRNGPDGGGDLAERPTIWSELLVRTISRDPFRPAVKLAA